MKQETSSTESAAWSAMFRRAHDFFQQRGLGSQTFADTVGALDSKGLSGITLLNALFEQAMILSEPSPATATPPSENVHRSTADQIIDLVRQDKANGGMETINSILDATERRIRITQSQAKQLCDRIIRHATFPEPPQPSPDPSASPETPTHHDWDTKLTPVAFRIIEEAIRIGSLRPIPSPAQSMDILAAIFCTTSWNGDRHTARTYLESRGINLDSISCQIGISPSVIADLPKT